MMHKYVCLSEYPDYIISTRGQIFSTKLYAGSCLHELSYETTKDGYLRVSLSHNGVVKRLTVHTLVALAFIPNPNNLPVIDHVDRNKQNNCVYNLRWATYSENERNKGNKHINCYSLQGSFIIQYTCIQEAVEALFRANITSNIGAKAHICSCCKGRLPHAYGMRWSYAE